MFKEKYDINPNYLALWSGIYLLTIIPAYQILFTRVPYLFLMIVMIENMVCFYVFEDEVLDDLVQAIKGKALAFFAISIMVALMLFLNLIFSNFKLFITICIIEFMGFVVIRLLGMLKKNIK